MLNQPEVVKLSSGVKVVIKTCWYDSSARVAAVAKGRETCSTNLNVSEIVFSVKNGLSCYCTDDMTRLLFVICIEA